MVTTFGSEVACISVEASAPQAVALQRKYRNSLTFTSGSAVSPSTSLASGALEQPSNASPPATRQNASPERKMVIGVLMTSWLKPYRTCAVAQHSFPAQQVSACVLPTSTT